MITRGHISSLEPCEPHCEDGGEPCEMKAAMAYLLANAPAYGTTTPALTPLTRPDEPRKFLALAIRVNRAKSESGQAMISALEMASELGESTIGPVTPSELYSFLIREILTRANSGSLLVTSGLRQGVLDVFLEQFGVMLCDAGYVLGPRLSGGSVSYLRISRRGGRESWSLVYAETMSGARLSTLVGYARVVGKLVESPAQTPARQLYGAIAAYQDLIRTSFGVALNPTAGMIALSCVRHSLPAVLQANGSSLSFRKWRPDPLLVAMERTGRGYRGGLTYAERYRGPTTRIDVVRQYTAALATELPYRSAFGRWTGPDDRGVYLCSVRFDHSPPYPIGVWNGERFVTRSVTGGVYVCVLHTSEFPGLEAHGATIAPWYGFRYTATFTLAGYVQRLQSLLDQHGYESHLSKLIKPLGNYVYGKFGQEPHRKELRFSKEYPGDGSFKKAGDWYPYVDDMLKRWPMVWERECTSYTSSQHVEIAGTITGAARSQTLLMWAMCATSGATIVRCHTDSLTVATESLPTGIRERLNTSLIGAWRAESLTGDSYVVAPNAYTDERGAHVAGVIDPTIEMVERVYNGEAVEIVQQENTPLRGFGRGQREVRKRFG